MRRKINVDINLSPWDLAAEFANLNSNDQARFFNHLATITEKWPGGMAGQLQFVTDDPLLSDEGRAAMSLIGEYADKSNGGGNG